MLLHAGLGTGVGTLVMFWQTYFRGLLIAGLSWFGVPFPEYADTTSERLLEALEGVRLAVLGGRWRGRRRSTGWRTSSPTSAGPRWTVCWWWTRRSG